MTFAEIEKQINITLEMHNHLDEIEGEENNSDFINDVEKLLNELGDKEEEKIDSYGHFISKLQAEEERLAVLIRDISNRKKSIINKIESVKTHLKFNMLSFGIMKISGNIYTASIRNNESVDIIDPLLIPAELNRIKTEPDKTEIKKLIKSGVVVAGAQLIQTQSVSIKA